MKGASTYYRVNAALVSSHLVTTTGTSGRWKYQCIALHLNAFPLHIYQLTNWKTFSRLFSCWSKSEPTHKPVALYRAAGFFTSITRRDQELRDG
jgi:hypothetical protein